jgi:hypothetical protein
MFFLLSPPQRFLFPRLQIQPLVSALSLHYPSKLNLFFFLLGLGFELIVSHLQNRAPYHLSHTSSPFCSGYFGDGCLANYLPWLASKHNPPDLSLLSRIIGVSHQCPANSHPFIHPSTHSSFTYPSILLSIRSPTHPLSHLSIHSSIYHSVHPYMRSSFIRSPPTKLSIHLSIHSLIYSLIHPSAFYSLLYPPPTYLLNPPSFMEH